MSKTGIFIPTDRQAEINEEIRIDLYTPDGGQISMNGNVVHVFYDQHQKQRGLGIRLGKFAPDQEKLFQKLVDEAAQRQRVRPAAQDTISQSDDDGIPIYIEESSPTKVHVKVPTTTKASSASAPKLRPVTPAKRAPIVGIDFGTSCSSVAVVIRNEVNVLQWDDGRRDIPSVVGFLKGGNVVVGAQAKEMLISDPANAISSPKRILGRLASERELETYWAHLSMPHTIGRDGQVTLRAQGRSYSVSQICAPILSALKQLAQKHLQQEIRQVVLAAPVSYDKLRYQALRETAALAGLEVVDILDEPTAAALAHRYESRERGQVAVFDFGGGTFDVSIVDTAQADMKVLATAGDSWLGGDDFDEALAKAAANSFWRENKIEIQKQIVQWQRLLLACEQAKRALSQREETVISVPQIALCAQGPIDLNFSISRKQFSSISSEVIERSLACCQEALDLCQLTTQDLCAVYLSGGTCYVPAVREAVTKFFGRPPLVNVPPERSVVIGAAMYAAQNEMGRISTF